KTFSIGFPDEDFDELKYARIAAERYSTDHHEFQVEPHALEIMPKLARHYGEPYADPSGIPSFYLAELTRRHVTVALNGDGGDENFGGYRRYLGNNVAERVAGWPRPARGLLRLVAHALGPDERENSFRSRLDRVARTSRMPAYDRYARWMAYFPEGERQDLYTPEFNAELRDRTAPSIMRDAYLASDAEDELNRLLDLDVQTYLPGDLLVKMDIASMAHSLEVRSPLLDH